MLLYPAIGLATLVGLPRLKATLRPQRKHAPDTPLDAATCNLTRREMQVLRLLARDHTYRSIADELVVSEETVRTHVKSILHKLKQPDRRQSRHRAAFPDRRLSRLKPAEPGHKSRWRRRIHPAGGGPTARTSVRWRVDGPSRSRTGRSQQAVDPR